MSITILFQEASGSFAATSGRVLEVVTLGDSPTVIDIFDYATLTFAVSGIYSVASGVVVSGSSGNYYAYQWGNAGGWSLESPWIKGSGQAINTCLVYGTCYNLDGSPASGAVVSGVYNESNGILVGSTSTTVLGRKSKAAVVAGDGGWSMELLRGVHVKFTNSSNPKLNSEGIVPDLSTALIDSFAVNI